MSASNNIVHKHLDNILADYKSHIVPDEYRSMSSTSQWSYAEGYMTWFYSVSHPVMTLDTHGHPPKPAHEEIIKHEYVRDEHSIDVLLMCLNIMQIMYEDIESGMSERGDDNVVSLAFSILTEARNDLGYPQPRRN